jgi:Spy/CpxP family protein refolding chaperone
MKRNFAAMLFLSYLCILLATSAYAAVDGFMPASDSGGKTGPGYSPQGQGGRADMIKNKLGLTDAQMEQLRSMREKNQSERKAHMDAVNKRIKALLTPDQQALWDKSVGEMKPGGQGGQGMKGKFKAVFQEMGLNDSQKSQIRSIMQEERGKMQAQRQTVENEMKSILTPEQSAKFEEMKKARMEGGGKRGDGKGMRKGRGMQDSGNPSPGAMRRGNRGLPSGEDSEKI